MNIILFHNHYDEDHLNYVVSKMNVLGEPKIKAVWVEAFGAYVALEGCHRLRAAHTLGLIPQIEEVDYSDVDICEIIPDSEDGMLSLSMIVDDAWRNEMLTFDNN